MGPKNWPERFVEETSLDPAGSRTPDRPARFLVTEARRFFWTQWRFEAVIE